jgi:small GTP-binding protein
MQNKKIIFLGDSGVGKTAFLNRALKGVYSEETDPTVGASFAGNTDPVLKIKCEMYDVAGRERYHWLLPMYAKDANAAVIFLDFTQDFDPDKFKKQVDAVPSGTPICVVVNKVEGEVDTEKQQSFKDGVLGVLGKESPIFFTSAKKNKNVVETFERIKCWAAGSKYTYEEYKAAQEMILTESGEMIPTESGMTKVPLSELESPSPGWFTRLRDWWNDLSAVEKVWLGGDLTLVGLTILSVLLAAFVPGGDILAVAFKVSPELAPLVMFGIAAGAAALWNLILGVCRLAEWRNEFNLAAVRPGLSVLPRSTTTTTNFEVEDNPKEKRVEVDVAQQKTTPKEHGYGKVLGKGSGDEPKVESSEDAEEKKVEETKTPGKGYKSGSEND